MLSVFELILSLARDYSKGNARQHFCRSSPKEVGLDPCISLPLCCLARRADLPGGTHWPHSAPFKVAEIHLGAQTSESPGSGRCSSRPISLRDGSGISWERLLIQMRASSSLSPLSTSALCCHCNVRLRGRAVAHVLSCERFSRVIVS